MKGHKPECRCPDCWERLREELSEAEIKASMKDLEAFVESMDRDKWRKRAEAAEEMAQYWEGRCNFAWARMDEMFLAHWDNAILTEKEAKLRAVVEAAKEVRPENWMDVPSIHRLIDLYKALDALEGCER